MPDQLVELRGACLSSIPYKHRIIVEHPFLNRMQPALVVTDEPTLASEFLGVGVIFPSSAPHPEPFSDRVFAARIGLINSALRTELKRNSTGELIKQLCNSSVTEPPYYSRSLEKLERWITHAASEGLRLRYDAFQMNSAMSAALNGPEGECLVWSPIALTPCEIDVADHKSWQLLDAWDEWEKRGVKISKRAEELFPFKTKRTRDGIFRARLHYLKLAR